MQCVVFMLTGSLVVVGVLTDFNFCLSSFGSTPIRPGMTLTIEAERRELSAER